MRDLKNDQLTGLEVRTFSERGKSCRLSGLHTDAAPVIKTKLLEDLFSAFMLKAKMSNEYLKR